MKSKKTNIFLCISAALLIFIAVAEICQIKVQNKDQKPFYGMTIVLAGDSRSSTDYPFYKEILEQKSGAKVCVEGASGQTTAYNASDEYFLRIEKNPYDYSIWLVGGNDTGEPGSIGTFAADSALADLGERVVAETDIARDYTGETFIQAVDHIMRKYKAAHYDFKENSRVARMIFCTDIPQQRESAESPWSQRENWERKRLAILECSEKNGIPCLDLYELCSFDMSFEPMFTAPTDMVHDRGTYYMDGLHPNRYGIDLITNFELDMMKLYRVEIKNK